MIEGNAMGQATDERDKRYSIARAVNAEALYERTPTPYPPRDRETFEDEFGPIKRQADPSCAVHGILAAHEHAIHRLSRYSEKPILSAQFLYWCVRQLVYPKGDGPETRQLGVTHRDTLKALRIYGVCPENQWQEQTMWHQVEPPADRFVHALKYRIVRYNTVAESMLYTVLQVHVAVAAIVMLYQDWVRPDMYSPDGGITPAPRTTVLPPGEGGASLGYHSIVLCGFDKPGGFLRIRNSWGDVWADRGYAWIPDTFLSRGELRDFWCVTEVTP